MTKHIGPCCELQTRQPRLHRQNLRKHASGVRPSKCDVIAEPRGFLAHPQYRRRPSHTRFSTIYTWWGGGCHLDVVGWWVSSRRGGVVGVISTVS